MAGFKIGIFWKLFLSILVSVACSFVIITFLYIELTPTTSLRLHIKNIILKAAGAIEALLFIPIFTFFMLFFRDRAERFAHKLAKKRHAELAEKLIRQISKVTIKYVSGVTTVVFILAIVHSAALSIIGIKYAIVLGIITASFSFVPYFGTIISGIIPVIFTILAQDNPYLAFAVAIYYAIISLCSITKILLPVFSKDSASFPILNRPPFLSFHPTSKRKFSRWETQSSLRTASETQ